jgi:sugar-specific transcriptional regulator TrmB
MAGPDAVAIPEALLREFEQLDLSPYEARVLLALLRLGSANTSLLARLSGVPRTSAYQVLEELNRKGLAQRQSAEGPVTWASPGRKEVFDRLDAEQEDRLRRHRARTGRLRDELARTFPETPDAAATYVHVIQRGAQIGSIFVRLVSSAREELLVLDLPPYESRPHPGVCDLVLAAVRRGVDLRTVYEDAAWHDDSARPFREAMARVHDAGAAGRVVDALPGAVAIADRSAALIAMVDPVLGDGGVPTMLLVEHPGFAALQAEGFERIWESAKPVGDEHRSRPPH